MLDHSPRPDGPAPSEHKRQPWDGRAGDDAAPFHRHPRWAPTDGGQRPGLAAQLREVWALGGLSFKEFARQVIDKVQTHDCLGQASQLAYYFLFAIFPFFLFLTALLAYLPITDLMGQI